MGAHMAAHAAHRRKIKAQQDRAEEMTTYTSDDLERYEFKIMRSYNNRFRKPTVLTQMLAEEQMHGWELLEKLDNGRVRLVRPRNTRRSPAPTGSDPYRTVYGGGAWGVKFLTVTLILGVMLLSFGIILMLNGVDAFSATTLSSGMIAILIIFMGVAAAIVARSR